MAKIPVLSISSGFYDIDREPELYEGVLKDTPVLNVLFDGKSLHLDGGEEEIISALNNAFQWVDQLDDSEKNQADFSETLIRLSLLSRGTQSTKSNRVPQKSEQKLVYPSCLYLS